MPALLPEQVPCRHTAPFNLIPAAKSFEPARRTLAPALPCGMADGTLRVPGPLVRAPIQEPHPKPREVILGRITGVFAKDSSPWPISSIVASYWPSGRMAHR